MSTKKNSLTRTIMIIIITILLTEILTPFISKPFQYLSENIFNKNNIKYKIISDIYTSKKNLEEIISKNFIEKKIDFSYDDDFVNKYHLTLIELSNTRKSIEDDIVFSLNFNDSSIKMISILGKLIKPYDKEEYLEYNKPPLKFGYDNDTISFSLEWQSTPNVIGTLIYRSLSDNGGFGQRSNSILKKQGIFKDKILKGQQYYYSMVNIADSGIESLLCPHANIPVRLYNVLSFKNCIKIEMSMENTAFEPDSLLKNEKKILDSIMKGKNVIVDIDKKLFYQWFDNPEFNNKIYFNEDLLFMHGKTKIHLTNLPSYAKYKIYIISKSVKTINYDNLKIQLLNKNYIKISNLTKTIKLDTLEEKTETIKYFNYNYNYEEIDKMKLKKDKLTPFKTKILNAKSTIILCWTIPQDTSYKFIRIFKREIESNNMDIKWGKEIYHGAGTKDTIYSKYEKYVQPYPPKIEKVEHLSDPFTPPPLQIPEPPMPPIGFSLSYADRIIINFNYDVNQIMPYFIDRNVIDKRIYVYTIITYNNSNEYSFPIETIIKYQTNNKDFAQIIVK